MALRILIFFFVFLWITPETISVEIGTLPNEQHQISGTLHILDSNTLYIEDFNYDGGGPGAYLYYYAPGQTVNRNGGGVIIPLPSQFGQSDGRFKSSRYTDVDITVTMPEGTDVCDIGTLIVWCQPFRAIFTRIEIPRSIFENDGADPCTLPTPTVITPPPPEFDNCIPLHETLQLSWRVDNDNSNIRFRLCGCQSIDSNTNQYMGFGLSGSTSTTLMFGADPTIAWVDETDGPQAVDYYLSAYTQCRDGEGACPDEMDSSESCTNDISNITGSVTDGQQCVSFTRQFSTSDSTCDITIDPDNTNQYIVWGVGGLGETAFKHFIRASFGDDPIHLGRDPEDQCNNTQLVCQSCMPFENERIIALENTTFQARIGPSGNERGYMGITGRAGWGISWYINGTLIPELVVERGKTYTFIIEGGTDSNDLSNYHPFYISDSIGGGRLQNTEEERANETVYAGFDELDQATGVGRLCQLEETEASETTRQNCGDLQMYIDTLETPASCNSGEPGKLVWTPDENTPDLVYYQCATHLNLGWKITVVDAVPSETEFDNCIPLHEALQLSWKVDNDNSNVRFRLCGCQSIDSNNQYMGFGLSGSTSATLMIGADPTIAWVDETDGPQAVDYYLSAYTQCRDGEGACPDEMDSSGSCTNDISNITGSVTDGQQCVSFTRQFSTSDSTCDITIDPNNTNQYIVWGVGGLGETAFKHFIRADATDDPIHLGREPQDQCVGVQFVCESCIPFENERIIALGDTTFQARIGPSGNERGYMGITGRAGWGISWYINGTLIPELVVERGKTYTFIIEGGNDSNDLSNYHPFYISDSIGGGRLQNTEEERANETVYAGFDELDQATGVGHLCQLMETEASETTRQTCGDLQMYIDTLETPASCNSGEPGKLVWTPDENTPDLVYYQCATHLNLGWKITVVDAVPTETEFDNCIPLHDALQLSWKVDNDNSNVRFRLCGCQSIDSNNQYMGFGLSGSTSATLMFGADPTIAWVDETDGPQAVDYYLSGYTQCRDGRGACPDELDSSGTCTNDISDITGSVTNGQQCVSFTRQFSTSDSTCDITIDPNNTNQYIVWGVGGLGETAFKHFIRAEPTDDPIHLGREPQDQCVGVQFVCESCIPFENERIIAREDTTFQARIGPSGNERGYMGITGRAGWGISWYINGTLIPELVVERGKTYTFIIEGGNDTNDLSNFHPFYISDSIGGGRLQNTEEERAIETVYAGFDEIDEATGVGRLCQLMETAASETSRESCSDLQTYIDTLETPASCNSGEPGKLVWTPDENTPDLVYYQCATHLNLGWKITVVDATETEFDNCISLHETLQLSWTVDNDNSNVRFRLCGCQSTDSDTNQYMGFGLSDSSSNTLMIGADPTITWVDETDGPQAVDYYLSAYSPCRDGRGACPDEMDSSGSCTNDISNITGSVTNGQQCVSFTRQFSTSDSTCDITIDPNNTDQYIVWGVGGLGETVMQHLIRAEATDDPIHLGREPQDQCVGVQFVCESCIPFENELIIAREDTTFQARIGPSGNERGYMGITGRAGWGISWYINGILIPELVVGRNRTYTFIIEGGNDINDLSNYHPFYITDSISGGRLQNTEEERANETVFAGFDNNDQEIGVGRLCQLMETAASETSRESCSDLQTYIDTLETPASCNSGEPGILVWTPDENTPDLVYYQSATRQNVGWKITVQTHDSALHFAASLMLCLSMAIATTLIIY